MNMLFEYQICILWISLYSTSYAVERLWIIRHCDKPFDLSSSSNNQNYCCSDIGYQRAEKWHLFFDKNFNSRNVIQMYASNFDYSESCRIFEQNYMSSQPKKYCQKSQRMYSTAYYIKENLESLKHNVKSSIDTEYCIGEVHDLLYSIQNNNHISDAVVIWEHKEIIDIIRKFDIDINDWIDDYKDIYDIVFMIDLKKKKLYYDCYDYRDSSKQCIPVIKSWLKHFDHIQTYMSMIQSIDRSIEDNIILVYLVIVFASIICFMIYLFYLCVAYDHTSILMRQKYVELV